MPREIVIDFTLRDDQPAISEIHRIRNFGQDLCRACRADGWASIPLEQVDRATNQLRVAVRSKRRIRRITALISQLLEKHFLAPQARISEIIVSD
ncbi:MAG TPA: hypothetical protein VK432_07680 [Stellaceae bacterium]|nr:hypothetical protein [Stellaceae bacterium]